MQQLKWLHWLMLGAGGLILMVWLSGCPLAGRSRIDARKLPGTWRATLERAEVILVFDAAGTLRVRAVPHNAWARFLAGGEIDFGGRWQLQGDHLTVEFSETPPIMALWGENWNGRIVGMRIERLTDSELVFADPKEPFYRPLAPAK